VGGAVVSWLKGYSDITPEMIAQMDSFRPEHDPFFAHAVMAQVQILKSKLGRLQFVFPSGYWQFIGWSLRGRRVKAVMRWVNA
jgi:hypothetical protein